VRTIGPNLRRPPPSTGASRIEDIADRVEVLTLSDLTSDIPIANAPETKPRPPTFQAFRLLDLPYELRLDVYKYHFLSTGHVLDLDPLNHKRIYPKLAILRVCRTLYREASHYFYSTHPVRLFPTHPGRFFKTKRPLLARLKTLQRQSLSTLELRLGPGWSKPPRGWVVNPELGLAECTHVRKVTVFLECDPGTDTFHGFRQPHEFFEGFAQSLLENVLNEMPWVAQVEFDAWSSVRKSGTLVQRLLDVVKSRHLLQTWGPERGWTDADEPEPRSVRNTFVPLIIAGAGVRRDALTPPL